MRKSILFCLMVAFIGTAYSQALRVEGIVELTQDLSARTSPRVDNNGTECAILRINIPSIREVYFSSTIVGDPIYAPGEYTVYVPANSKRVDLTCEGKPLSIVFSDFQIALQPKSCYRVVVKKEMGNNVGAEGYARVKVTANYEDDILLIDGVPVGQLPLYLDDITLGPHTFSIPNVNGRTMEDTVITIKRGMNEINLRLELKDPQLLRINMIFYGGEGHDIANDEVIWGARKATSNGKCGFVDYCGNEIIPVKYDRIYEDYDNSRSLYRVERNYRWGLFKLGEGEIIPPNDTINNIEILSEDSVVIYSSTGNEWLFSLSTKQKKAYVRNAPPVIIGNYMVIRDKDGVKIMNARKEIILNVTGDYEIRFDPQYDIVAVGACRGKYNRRQCNYRLYDLSTGNEIVLPQKYQYVNIWYGLIEVEDTTTSMVGFLDRSNNIVIPFNYKKQHGLEYAYQYSNTYPLFGGRFRYYDYNSVINNEDYHKEFTHGTIILETYRGDTIGSHRKVIGRNIHYYYDIRYDTMVYNTSGKIIAQTGHKIPQQYRFHKKLRNGCIICKDSNGKLGILDSVGNVILPFIYDSIFDYTTMAFAKKRDGTGIGINIKGEILLPTGKYKEILSDRFCSRIHVLTHNEFLMYNDKGECVARFPVSADAHFVDYGHSDGYNHFAIKSGNTIIRRMNDERLYQVVNTKTGKYGFISNMGELVTNCIYDELSDLIDVDSPYGLSDAHEMSINMYSAYEGFGILRLGDRFGFIDTQGNVVVPLVYTAATPFINGVSIVRDANNNCTKIYSKDLK